MVCAIDARFVASCSTFASSARRSVRPFWIPSGTSRTTSTKSVRPRYPRSSLRVTLSEGGSRCRGPSRSSPGSPSLRRRAATWTSIVFDDPLQLVCQTSSSNRRRLIAAPGSRARAASSSNSFGVSASSTPSSSARRARSSTSRPPTRSGAATRSGSSDAPRDGTDAGDQLAQPERLDDVVVGAELEADDSIRFLAARGHDDDRHLRPLAQPAADVEAVHVRKAQVEEDDVGLRRRESLGTGRRARHVETLPAEPFGQRKGDRVFVLDNQDLHGAHRRTPRDAELRTWTNLCDLCAEAWRCARPSLASAGVRSRTSTLSELKGGLRR